MSAMRTIVRRPSGGINWSVILWILATARTSSQFSLSSPPDATSRTPPTPTNEGPFALVDGTNNDDGGDDDDNVLLPASGRFRLTLFRSAPNTDDIDGNNDCPPIDMPVPMAVSGSGAGPVSVSMFMSMSSPLALPPLSLQRCDGIFLYGREIVHSESDATLATLEVLTMDQPDRNRAPHVLHRPAATIATTLWDATLVIEPDQPAETTQQQHTSHGCFVAMNRFRVRDRCKALFEARWANRRSKLSLQPGFVGFSLLRKRKHNHNGNGNGNGNDNGNENENDKRRRITKSLEFATELPALQETVHVVGFPTGGRTICVTEGVVSRIDLHHRIVAIQVDSAINPGNSGGPAFNSRGQVTGVAFLKRISTKSQKVDNIGYLIPAVLVRSFLGRVDRERGTYQLSGTIPYRWHSLENHSLRLAHGVPDSIHGVLITSVADDPAPTTNEGHDKDKDHDKDDAEPSSRLGLGLRLQPGDILTKIDDSEVADDGQVVLRGDELIQHAYLMRIKKKGESVTFTVYRDGRHVVCDPYHLKDIQPIIPRWENVDYMPNYMILGSLVLLPAFLSMRHFKQCGHLLKADCIESYRRWPREWEGKEGLVVLTEIFAHELSFSYGRPWRRVVSYNGEKIKSLRHLQELWTASREHVATAAASAASTATAAEPTDAAPEEDAAGDATNDENVASGNETEAPPPPPPKTLTFVRLELENDDDIVFEVEAAMKAQQEVMATHAISKPYNILPRNPQYI
mmetsp:Transcript_3694/g.10458  ORF Transcript_3694/g.10458 Transcript_3694/m.10458 type:complete len:743 (-) Transcript_3694:613-2841(-)